ncbi:hypothetical protein HAX54_014246, partial [Datura stramonium]|nr:hypothetical protein [Datura stramonium]
MSKEMTFPFFKMTMEERTDESARNPGLGVGKADRLKSYYTGGLPGVLLSRRNCLVLFRQIALCCGIGRLPYVLYRPIALYCMGKLLLTQLPICPFVQ